MLKSRNFNEIIERLIEIFYEEHRRRLLETIRETKLPEEEVKKVKEAVRRIRERDRW